VSSSPRSDTSAEVVRLLQLARFLAEGDRSDACRAAYGAAIRLDQGFSARNEYGAYLWRVGSYDEAIEQFRRLLRQAWEEGDTWQRSIASNNLAAVYRSVGQTARAHAFQQQSIRNASDADADPLQTACDLGNRACDALLAGEFRLAEQLLLQSLLLESASGNLEGQAADWGNFGVLYGQLQAFGLGTRCLLRAYHLHAELNDARGCGMDLINLADLFERAGREQRAIRCLHRAVMCLDRAQATRLKDQAERLEAALVRRVSLRCHDPSLN